MPTNTIFLFVILAILIGVIVVGLAGIVTLVWQQDYLDTAIQLAWAWLTQEALQLGLLAGPIFRPDRLNPTTARQYTWHFPVRSPSGKHAHKERFSVKLPLSLARYQAYSNAPRNLNPYCFDQYVTVSAPEVVHLANKLLRLGRARGYQATEQLCFTLAFIQQGIRYAPDISPHTGQIIEYPKYPLETLMDRAGDCEDQAILAAALLQRMGYQVALLVLPTHVALGVAGLNLPGAYVTEPTSGICYYYVETTVPHWLPGEVPRQFQPELVTGDFDILPVMVTT